MGYASSLRKLRLRNNRHDSCEVVTRMLYGNVQQIDNIYQPPPFSRFGDSPSKFFIREALAERRNSEHSLMVEHYYVIIGGVGSSPTVLDYFKVISR